MIDLILAALSWLAALGVMFGIFVVIGFVLVEGDREREARARRAAAEHRAARVAAAMKRRVQHHQRALAALKETHRRELERVEQARREEQARWHFSVPLGGAVLSPAPLAARPYRVDVTAGETQRRVIQNNGGARPAKAELPVITFDAYQCPVLEYDPSSERRVAFVIPRAGRKVRIAAEAPGDYFPECERLLVKIAPLGTDDATAVAALDETERAEEAAAQERAASAAERQAREAEKERRAALRASRKEAEAARRRAAEEKAAAQRAWRAECAAFEIERRRSVKLTAERNREALADIAEKRAYRLRALEVEYETGGYEYANPAYVNGYACMFSDELGAQRERIIRDNAAWHADDPAFVDDLKANRPELYAMRTWRPLALATRDRLVVETALSARRTAEQPRRRRTTAEHREAELARMGVQLEDAAASVIALVTKEQEVAERLAALPIDEDRQAAAFRKFKGQTKHIAGEAKREGAYDETAL